MDCRVKGALIVAASATVLALSGCGSSADGGTSPRPQPLPAAPPAPPPPPPPPPAPAAVPALNYNDAEYARSNGANAHTAIAAYNSGATGRGVKIGIIDSGINPNLPEFAGKIDAASRDMVANRGLTDTEGHGTAVSAVAAGARNGDKMMGVAFGASIISLNTSNPNNCDAEDGCTHSDGDIALALDAARVAGARIVNISLGGADVSGTMLNAVQRATSAGVIIVMSAGNNGEKPTGANPEGFALSSAQQAGNGLVIIAGAHDAYRNMAAFSNRAGTGAQHYLTALGSRVQTINEEGVSALYSGTSFSAPVISGAAALLASAFPNLTGAQIVQLLLTTADDAGAQGRDDVYGNGILNIQRAFQPQGQTSLAGSSVVVDSNAESQASGAMGQMSGDMVGAIILDGYSRAYAVDLASRIQSAPQERPLGQAIGNGVDYATSAAAVGKTSVTLTTGRDANGNRQLRIGQAGLNFENAGKARAVAATVLSRLTPQSAVAFGLSESGHVLRQRLAEREGSAFLVARDPTARMGFHAQTGSSMGVRHDVGPVTLSASAERGEVKPANNVSVSSKDANYNLWSFNADRQLGPVNISIGGTQLQEDRSLLGGRFSSAFSSGGSISYFVDTAASLNFGGGWGGGASHRRGWSSMSGTGALMERSRLSTDAFAFDLYKKGLLSEGDKLAARIMQPLRVRSGGFDLKAPVRYDYATGAVGYEDRFFNLAPAGREIYYELTYGTNIYGGSLDLNAFLRTDPGHNISSANDLGGAIRFTLGF